mgnify:CR=1 FL=1
MSEGKRDTDLLSLQCQMIASMYRRIPSDSWQAFQSALGAQEMGDIAYVRAVLPADSASSAAVERVGVSKLRSFLEQLLRERYLRNLGTIIPQLQQACGLR